jgi:hypothetical protein
MLKKVAPEKTVKRLVTNRLTLNRTALTLLTNSDVLSKKKLETIALKVIRGYRERYGDERKLGASVSEATEEALNGRKLMVARVQSATVHEITKDIKREYRGEYYKWIPSSAAEPDPLHQLNYGLTFQLGKGEAPGDRYGCQCGMEILVDETKLAL